ncbi:protein FAM89B-like [Elysia marginata]|uniref:Protein FAM89B-like n=1 Tax=Elysia marginata TaxID=1093978 RepID=A0AAV4EI94_9GAST|nr:protein FAM89B-like [Elysia marginata]
MQNLLLSDYPPIPECFTHLISQGASQQSELDHERIVDITEAKSQINYSAQTQNQSNDEELNSAQNLVSHVEPDGTKDNTLQKTFQKLNSSLEKLQREMKDLRSLDISLFYQLIALNEAIQDFKLNCSDRFSESGSEYSLGTASYMGSMTSLNDDSDWAEDGTLLNSPLLDGNDTLLAENQDSTKELLMQISDLALKAEQDF